MKKILPVLLCISVVLFSACSTRFSHTNIQTTKTSLSVNASKASLNVRPDRGRDDSLVILAFSGGGSRSAYWATSFMFKMQQIFDDADLLTEVDAISSVSGGSLPAAYYAISTDEGSEGLHGRVWNEKKVKSLMKKNYIMKWFGNWFWPTNIAKFWFTSYDRSDIMAQTLTDNLYDKKPLGMDLTLGDINKERPYLILNATNGTNGQFAKSFTFTKQDFQTINSDINDYELGRAVMATATFPAVFNYMTLRNFAVNGDVANYTHVFDGGNVDNLGLMGVQRILDTLSKNGTTYEKLVVILVDAYNGDGGVSSTDSDSREFLDFIVDTNFIDATNSLLAANRKKMLANFEKYFRDYNYEIDGKQIPKLSKAIFYHVQFEDLKGDGELVEELAQIKTNFNISNKDVNAIERAAEKLFTVDNRCIRSIKELLVDNQSVDDPICSYVME